MNIKDEILIYIKVMVNTKKWEINHKLPSEHELATQFFCSRLTVRNAYQKLVAEGYLWARKGAGYFVRKKFINIAGPKIKTNLITNALPKKLNPLENNWYNNLTTTQFDNENQYPSYLKIYYDEDNKAYQFIKSYVNPSIFKLVNKRSMEKSIAFAYLEKNIFISHRKRIIVARALQDWEKKQLNYQNDDFFVITYSILIDKNKQLIEFSTTYTKPAYTEIYCDQELN